MVCEMVRLGEPIDLIIFADTGGERPDTYEHIDAFSAWLKERGYPCITKIGPEPCAVFDTTATTLEEECLMRRALPSLAYGFRSCSVKWKLTPIRKFIKAIGQPVVMCIAFDAGERHRAERGNEHSESYTKRYPLIEWGWGRDECMRAIRATGLKVPGKSSCFFCPSTRIPEIFALRCRYPDLFERALAMERNAELSFVKGLGRNFSWSRIDEADRAQLSMFPPEIPCGCVDGDEE
jgi:hypothetical protein